MARGARGAANERTSEGLVLRCVDYAEADRVCTVLLREEGKRSFFAKGARSRTKRFRGGLGAFSLLKLRWVDKGDAKLAGLRESDVTTAYHGISQDLPKLAAGSWALELVEAMLEEHQGAGETFETVTRFLAWLDGETGPAPRVEAGLHRFAMMILNDAGVLPPLDRSSRSGEVLNDAALTWMPGDGLILATERRPGESGVALPAGSAAYLHALAAGRFPSAASGIVRAGVRRALSEEVRRHVGGPQRSFTLYDELFS